jgi:glycosyltransferase involved in cell wall biosynthesis
MSHHSAGKDQTTLNNELPDKKDLSLSVVICTQSNERYHDLKEAIQSVHDQTLPLKEIIVVIDHNKELLSQLRDEYSDIILTENKNKQGLSGGRNTGVKVATGDIILFLDDDAVAAPDWAERHSSHYSDLNVFAVGGTSEPLWLTGRPLWFPEEFDWVVGCTYRGLPETLQEVNKVIGSNCSFRREVFDVIGGFSLSLSRTGNILLSGEESEFCFRIKQQCEGSIILFDPDARVQHKVPPTRAKWSYFKKRCFYGGVSNYILVRLVGRKIGLSAERNFVLDTLVSGSVRYIAEGIKDTRSYGFRKAGVLIIGFFITFAGYLGGAIYSTFAKGQFEKVVYGE